MSAYFGLAFASSFYGPFRDAVPASNLGKSNKYTYQMDPANSTRHCARWRWICRKGPIWRWSPGMPLSGYRAASAQTSSVLRPRFIRCQANMRCQGSRAEWLAQRTGVLEPSLAFKRAGADGILTYFALRLPSGWPADSGPSSFVRRDRYFALLFQNVTLDQRFCLLAQVEEQAARLLCERPLRRTKSKQVRICKPVVISPKPAG